MKKEYIADTLPPKDFQYKPAHGKVLGNGDVLISGCNLTSHQIDTYGSSYAELVDIFQEIDAQEVGDTIDQIGEEILRDASPSTEKKSHR